MLPAPHHLLERPWSLRHRFGPLIHNRRGRANRVRRLDRRDSILRRARLAASCLGYGSGG
jgi:hypothetical protein